MKVWVVRGGERYDDYTATIGVCASREVAEELMDREQAWPDRWATIHEEELITELPEWEPPTEFKNYYAELDIETNEIVVWTDSQFGYESDVKPCSVDELNDYLGAHGTDRDAVVAAIQGRCEERGLRSVKVVEE